jgi:hypothetical protein
MEETDRLNLEREPANAPDKLEPAARRLGLKPATPGQIGNLDLPHRKKKD